MSATSGDNPVFTFDHMDIMHQLMRSLSRREKIIAVGILQSMVDANNAGNGKRAEEISKQFEERYSIKLTLTEETQ